MEAMNEWVKNAQSDLNNFKKFNDDNFNKLTEEQKEELNKAMKSIDMKSLNEVIQQSSQNIMNHIQGMFK